LSRHPASENAAALNHIRANKPVEAATKQAAAQCRPFNGVRRARPTLSTAIPGNIGAEMDAMECRSIDAPPREIPLERLRADVVNAESTFKRHREPIKNR
jgi:hypothetical protein